MATFTNKKKNPVEHSGSGAVYMPMLDSIKYTENDQWLWPMVSADKPDTVTWVLTTDPPDQDATVEQNRARYVGGLKSRIKSVLARRQQ